jgi:DNA-binding winged helix-turn-helix (wHTH) protein/Tol biopolymer transport system component
MIDESTTQLSFGEFRIDPDRRLLLRSGEVVPLKGKAFDLLITLVENRGRVLSKDELLDKLWENQFVEENNLTVHVAALRKALGEKKNEHRYIVTVPGKGYRFVGEPTQPLNGDVVVESRKFQKIVVSEELEEDHTSADPINGQGFDSPVSLNSGQSRKSLARVLIVVGLIVLAAAGIAGAIVYRAGIVADLFAASAPFRDHQVTQLTTNGKVGSAALSHDGKMFAYVIDDVGLKSLWIGRVDGGNHLQLNPPAEATYAGLAFSPDGSQLYYSIRNEKYPRSALFTVPVQGGVSTKLRDDVDAFALSPDGEKIAMGRRDKEKDVVVISSIDGSSSTDVSSFAKNESFIFDSLSWSNDGTRIALAATRPGHMDRFDLSIIDVASGSIERIGLPDYRQVTKTSWLRDGTGLIVTAIEEISHSSVPQYRIVYASYPGGETTEITTDRSNYGESWHNDAGATLSLDQQGEAILTVEHRQLSNVWIAPANDLSAARQITFSSFGRYDGLWGLDWSPDGKIIYTTSDTRNQYLAEMKGDGSEQKPLTNPVTQPGHVDSVLTVSADGRYILFHSNRTNGEFDIWRVDIDGSNPKQLTFGGKGFQPAPSSDGQWVYYKSFLNDIGGLCRVAIDGGDPECLTDKETSWASFSPDGKFLAASYITDKRRLAIFSAETHAVVRQFELPPSATLFMGSRWTPDGRSVMYRDIAYGYWVQDIDGSVPRRLEGLPKEKFYNFSWSRDGKWLAFVRGQEIRDVVLLRRSLAEP